MEHCLECKRKFKNERGLHIHLKKHGGVEAYYQSFFPRFDLYDKSVIEFKTKSQYFSSFFNSNSNRKRFYKENSDKKKLRDVFKKEFYFNQKEKGFYFLPSHNYLYLSKLTGFDLIVRLFGSIKEFCSAVSVERLFETKLPEQFWTREDFSKMHIFVDTREQKPFEYGNCSFNKLDFGDYVGAGEFYQNIFIDRKGIQDFIGTFGGGIDRFEKEIIRAKSLNSYLFVVVEGSVSDLFKIPKKFRGNFDYMFHNIRKMLLDYSEYFQIVFCKDREEAKDLTQRILFFGKESKNYDIQYELDKRATTA